MADANEDPERTTLDWLVLAGSKAVDVADAIGNALAGFFGITDSKYQWVIEEAELERLRAEQAEQDKREREGARTEQEMREMEEASSTTHLKRMCGDEMVKEAMREAVSAKKIVFRINSNPKGGSYTHDFFEGGALVVEVKPGNLACNVGDCGSELEKLL
eukprot:m51a1_g5988 hypothetical protein (160) ;mRNA; r:273483-274642